MTKPNTYTTENHTVTVLRITDGPVRTGTMYSLRIDGMRVGLLHKTGANRWRVTSTGADPALGLPKVIAPNYIGTLERVAIECALAAQSYVG